MSQQLTPIKQPPSHNVTKEKMSFSFFSQIDFNVILDKMQNSIEIAFDLGQKT